MLRIFFFFRLEPEGAYKKNAYKKNAYKNKRKGCNEKQEKRGGEYWQNTGH